MQTQSNKPELYAEALLALAKTAEIQDSITTETFDLADLTRDNEKLRRFIAENSISSEGKRQALQAILQDAVHPLLIDFATMLITAGDISLLEKIAVELAKICTGSRDTATGTIHSSTNLSQTQINTIESEISRIIEQKVKLQLRIDPNILAGIRVSAGDFVIDGTIDRQLDDARQQLMT